MAKKMKDEKEKVHNRKEEMMERKKGTKKSKKIGASNPPFNFKKY